MENFEKTREDLLHELQELRNENELLKLSFQKDSEKNNKSLNALRENEENQKIILDLTTDYFFKAEIDKTGKIDLKYISKNIDVITGRTFEESRSQDNWKNILHPDDYQNFLDYINNLMISGQQKEFEGRTFTKSGEQRYVNIISKPILGEDSKNVIAIIGAIKDITKRKVAEEALQESELRYKSLYNNNPLMIFTLNPEGIILSVNETGIEHLEYSRDELIGNSVLKLFYEEDKSKVIEQKDRCLLNPNETFSWELRKCTKKGELIWVKETARVLKDSKGSEYLLIICEDITQSKKMEESLHENESKFRTLFESANDSLFLMDQDIFIDCNQKTLEIFGCSRDQIIGHPPYLFSPEMQPDGRTSIEKAQEKINAAIKGQPQFFEWKHKRLDGTLFDAEVTLNAFSNMGKYLLQASVRDISERKQAEEKINRMAQILDFAPSSITIHDFSGNLIFANQRAYDLHGYSKDEFKNLPLSKLDTEDYAKQIPLRINEILEKGVANFEVEHYQKNGKILALEIIACSTKWGNSDAIVSIGTDITSRKKSEDELIKSEKKYRNLVDNSIQGIYQTTLEGDIIFCNNAILGILEFDNIDYTQMNIKNHYYNQEDRNRLLEILEKDGEVKNFETNLITLKGNLVSVIINSRLEDNYISGMMIDITERKRAEEALRESESRLILATRAGNIGIWDWDVINNYLVWDESMYFLYGISREKFSNVYEAWVNLLHPDDSIFAQEEILAALNGERDYNTEFRVIRPDKEIRNIQAYAQTFRDQNGKAIRMIGSNIDITDRKRSEEALKESEFFFKDSQRAAAIGSYKTDFVAGIWESSEVLDQIFGIDQDYSRTVQGWVEIVHPEDREMMANYLAEEVLSKHNPFNKEYRIIRKSDGEVRWVLGLGAVGLDNNGNVISLIGTIQDITERKKADEILIHAKEAAEKSEIKVRSMFENTATGIVFFSPEGNVLEANPSAIRMLGSPSLEATKTVNVLEYKPLIDIGFANDFLKCISENQVITGSSSYITKWNKELFIQYFLIPIFHNKEIIGVWANLQDLTDLWHSQKDLAKAKEIAEQSEHMIIDITNNIPVYIAVVDASTLCYKFVNSKYIDSFNKKREEIIGANIFEIIGKENAEFAMDYINEVRKGNLSSYVNTFDIREGKRYISVNYVPGFDENKEVKDIIVLSYDITDLKKTEEDLLNAKLKAEESDRLKTAFLQNISHEIRTPLNGILGFSNLLSKQEIPGHVIKEYTNLIQESGNKLLEIINDVLDISKIETGQIMVQIKPISINSLLADLFSFFSPTAKQKNLDLSYTTFLKRENSFIETDPTKLNQILTNLINNSIKFTKRGSVEFGYEIFGDEILFYVKDSGIGIPDEMQERIFERFIQSKLSISKGNEGTGLGLAICKGLVKILGGKIWLESEMHKGSTFYFSIPYRPFLEIEEINQVVTANENLLKKTTILIAEDHYISFRYLQELLQKDNIIILHAENGEQAIEFVKNNPDIDIVLMDIRMPVMDGIEATKLIKNIRPNLPIVAQTAYAFSDEKEMIISIGCTDYISKPIEKNELFKLIAKYTK